MSLVWSVGGQTMVPAYVCWVVCRGTDHGSRGQSVVPWDRPGLQGTDHGSSLSGDRPGLQGTDHGSSLSRDRPGLQGTDHGSSLSGDRPWFQSVGGQTTAPGDRPRFQGTDHGSRRQTTVPGDRARFHGSTLPPGLSPDRPFQAGYAPKTLASIASTGPASWFYGRHRNKSLCGKSSCIYCKMQCLARVAYLS
jgi:hypothetical protein